MTLDEGVDRSLLRGETEAEALRELAIAALRRWQQDRWEEE